MLVESFRVNSPNVQYTETEIVSQYTYQTTVAHEDSGTMVITPITQHFEFHTQRKVPKTGLMMVGLGGNNGTTLTAGVIANREGICWRTKEGVREPNYFGSLTQASTVRLAEGIFVPFKHMLPMVNPNDLVIGGWDISSLDLAAAMERARVLDVDLQRQVAPFMREMKPLPSIYYPDFIAANQADRADNVLGGSKAEHLAQLRKDIRDFKAQHSLDKVIILWTANTERFSAVQEGLNDTAANLLAAVERNEDEISPSTIFALAAIYEGVPFINGSPQNTLVPGVVEFALQHKVLIAGDDFKTGQTKFKSALVEFLVGAGIKPVAITSYNHLGNNDGKNLSSHLQFRSKEISKSNVVDDMVAANPILYKAGEHPDHTVVIKYVPYVGDSKRAMDEYVSEIFMGGINTIALHNTCEDSLLATPIMLDLILVAEMATRISFKINGAEDPESFHSVLSILSYWLKAPMVPEDTPVVNALSQQRACLENIFRACVGLPPENYMTLEHKIARKKL
eukprot:TRINITY_DN25_c0_g1_i1.p1 TRINITY_DN25_c0_g1~~TRINITY_DN25_c0_g1_i1.p1  ORF type:complete len:509 (-),score=107.53 TRINITY_DN25_c0_g1_i1:513-2039(-)